MRSAIKIWNNVKHNKTPVFFVLLFLLVYGLLYTANHVLTGAMQKGGIYSEWLDDNLDYVTVFRTFLLQSTAHISQLFGHDTFLREDTLFVKGGHNIRMIYSCIGMNLLFIWWSFVFAFPMNIYKKLSFFFSGTLALIALNILRLSVITLSPRTLSYKEWVIDHHSLYNCLIYVTICIVIRTLIKKHAL